MRRLGLDQPDIPQDTGTILRIAACLGVAAEIVAAAGFGASDGILRRAGLDYLGAVTVNRHASWRAFEDWRRGEGRRLVLASTKEAVRHVDFTFADEDVILLGRESAGVPDEVH